MIPKQAIEKAIEGGWKYSCTPKPFSPHGDGMECYYSGCNDEWSVWTRKDNGSSICVSHAETAFDPTFWQALGKTMGWAIIVDGKRVKNGSQINTKAKAEWLYVAHRFYNLILTGDFPPAFSGTEKFWEEILK